MIAPLAADRAAPGPEGGPLPASVHATGVVVGETGVMIRGASGAGKSRLAFALLEAARREGLNARLVGDDRLFLRATGGRIVAAGHPRIAGLIEQRGEGIIPAAFETSAVLHCVIDLVGTERDCGDLPRWPGETPQLARLGGILLPLCRLPALEIGLAELSQALRFARHNGPQNDK